MKILVVGSTGVLGRQVVPRLIERGHSVTAIVRRPEQAPFLREAGAEPVVGDILDRDSLDPAAVGCEAALHLATAIPPSRQHDWSRNDRIRREGTRNLLDAATRNGVRRYIQQSITMLYGDQGQAIVDESASFQTSATTSSATEMEEFVQASRLDWCILRGGPFYGLGTGREDAWREAARQGTLELPEDGSALISLIHVVDMARAVVAATECAPSGAVYNIVDDEPVSYRRLLTYIAAQLGAAPRPGGPTILPSLGCSNRKAKQELAWQPAYPTYRSGLA